MLLYTEKQLDVAYRIDCKARTKSNEPWITIEDFRPIYEDLLEAYMLISFTSAKAIEGVNVGVSIMAGVFAAE